MTPKQKERIKKEITKIKRALAADKRRWGGFYDDSQGLRYLPPELYLKLEDYTGALRYYNWFAKTFPDDIGHPIFLFEWTVTLFKTKRLKAATIKAFETYCANIYLLHHFLQQDLPNPAITPLSNWESIEFIEYLTYEKEQEELADFAAWLEETMAGETFQRFAQQHIDLEIQLTNEPVGPKRSALVDQNSNLVDEFAEAL